MFLIINKYIIFNEYTKTTISVFGIFCYWKKYINFKTNIIIIVIKYEYTVGKNYTIELSLYT